MSRGMLRRPSIARKSVNEPSDNMARRELIVERMESSTGMLAWLVSLPNVKKLFEDSVKCWSRPFAR
jgi:hypothetical protein